MRIAVDLTTYTAAPKERSHNRSADTLGQLSYGEVEQLFVCHGL